MMKANLGELGVGTYSSAALILSYLCKITFLNLNL